MYRAWGAGSAAPAGQRQLDRTPLSLPLLDAGVWNSFACRSAVEPFQNDEAFASIAI
jgi:hypothetical protein